MAYGSFGRRLAAGVAALGVVLAGALTAAPASADSRPLDPANPATPTTVSADVLPTVQIDSAGVVYSQVVVGRTVYAAGRFSNARPAGSASGVNTVARKNLLAYDIETGALVPGFAWALDGLARSITASPDGKRVYVVGDFTKVTNLNRPSDPAQTRTRIAAFDTATGALVSTFRPVLPLEALAVAASNDTVYVGGNFTSAAGTGGSQQPRARLAAFSSATGALTSMVANADAPVTALARTSDGLKLVVGGRFTQLAGSAAYGLGAVDPRTGARASFPASSAIRNAGKDSSITSLYADASGVYGTGYHFGPGGNLEGSFRAHATTGDLVWVADCHGDAYSVFPTGNEVYTASHHHYCGNMGGFPQTEPWSHYHGNAFSKAATGVNTADIYGYPDHRGRPAPSLLTWFPNFGIGTATGQSQAGWSVAGNDRYVVYGGEFPTVNGRAQQGLVRFARPTIAPNDEGPKLTGSAFAPRVVSVKAGTVRVTWRPNDDRDNSRVTYRVYRRGTATPIHTQVVDEPFWKIPTMTFTDTGLAAGSRPEYQVTATDPFDNTSTSTWVPVTVASSTTARAYPAQVLQDGAVAYWRLGSASGTTLRDWAGFTDSTASTGVTHGATGAIAGDPDRASTFNGTTAGYASTRTSVSAPGTFTLEAWVRTTSTTGGKIVGFGGSRTGSSKNYDRHLYMDNAGKIVFGTNPGGARTITSTSSYNNGQWHHVMATLSRDGMRLYVDGAQVAQRTDVTSGQRYSGFWRIGGDTIGTSWPSSPTSKYLNGTIDEVAVYPTALAASAAARHYGLRLAAASPAEEAPAQAAPTASFTATQSGASVAVDGSGSSDPEGEIASYAWAFGDGATATGPTASHTYTADGTYTVTLTVTDSAGKTASASRAVTVATTTTPPPPPPADGTDLAADGFTRSVTGGWGSATTGGAWTQTGTASSFAVADGVGRHVVTRAGSTLSSFLADVSSTTTDLGLTASIDKPATGGGLYLTAIGRRVGTADYRARVKVPASGAVVVQVGRGETALQSRTLTGVTLAPGEQLHLRVQVVGTSPTTLRAKAWKAGAAEPPDWQVTATDPTDGLQSAGGVGVTSYLSGTSTNVPVTVSWDDLRAVPGE